MLIGDVCRRTGLTRKAVRYYVEQGVVSPAALPNGYLSFDLVDVQRLERVCVLRRLGLSVCDARRALDGGALPLRDICARRQLSAQTSAQRDAILVQLAQDMDFDRAARALEQLDRRATIASKLLDAFPGCFGRFMCAHFGAFLDGALETDAQRAAYGEVIAFLDGVPDLPPEVRECFDLMDELAPEAASSAQLATEALRAVAESPERYIDEHAGEIARYMEYLRSPEYFNSPMYSIKRALDEFCHASGYNDVFIPALMRLSPSYERYQRDLERANAALAARFGDSLPGGAQRAGSPQAKNCATKPASPSLPCTASAHRSPSSRLDSGAPNSASSCVRSSE